MRVVAAKGLRFDYSDNKWFEPILICSDLFTNDKDRLDFFELIFINEKNANAKYLNEFDSNDVNTKFFIACKVAYNLREIHPSLFKMAEMFLGNLLTLWHYRYSENVLIMDFEYLIKAVASLSSEHLFKRFFYSLKNLECWFYNKEFDDRSNNEEALKLFDEKFNRYLKAFIENLNDFTLLYQVLNERKKAFNLIHSLSRSIYNNIKIFTRYLLQNSPTSQLIQAFKETKSIEILKEIGKSDLEFFMENYYSTGDANELDFYSFIGDLHIRNMYGVNFLIESFKDEKIETKIRLYILGKLLDVNEHLEIVFDALREVLNNKDVLIYFDDIKILLNKYSLKDLDYYGLGVIYTNPEIEKIDINLNFVSEKGGKLIFESHNNKLYYREILSNINTIYFNDRFIDFSPYSFDNDLRKMSDGIVVTESPDIIDKCFDKYYQGGYFTLHYIKKGHSITEKFLFKELFKLQSSGQFLIEIDNNTAIKVKALHNRYRNIKLLIGQEFRFSIKQFASHYSSIYLECNKANFNVNQSNNLFQLYKIKIDFTKPFNYHRDIIKSNIAFLRYLNTQLSSLEVINFIKSIGLAHLFLRAINDVNYGVVVSIYEKRNLYTIYRFIKNKMLNSYIKTIPNEGIKLNDIVLIEENLNISKVKKDLINDSYFLKSEIISISSDHTEGFIAGILGEKDYYFLSQYCDFIPRKGLTVKFIPGVNYSTKRNSSRPMAYCLSVIGNNFKLAKVIKVNKVKLAQDIFMVDINTGQKLFSRIYPTSKILNFNGNLLSGDIFSYYIPDRFKEVQMTQRINLVAKEPDTILDMPHST